MTSVCGKSGAAPGRRAFAGVVWSAAERGSTQLLGFIVTVVMARLLTPADYGLIGMLLLFMEVGEALASGGMAQALVARGTDSSADRRSAFGFNIIAGTIIYLILWFGAPMIADFYSEPILSDLTRAVGLTIPLKACACLPEALLMADLAYRRQAVASLCALAISSLAGIVSAIKGGGVWAIAAYMILQTFLQTLFLYLAALPYLRSKKHSSASLRARHASEADRKKPGCASETDRSGTRPRLLKYGLNLIGARLADVAYINSYLILIGRLFPVGDVGLFTRARQFASVPAISMNEIVRRVAYPVLCRFSNDEAERHACFSRMTGLALTVAFPVMLALAAMSYPVIETVLGEKWTQAAPLLVWLCLGMLWTPLDGLNLTLILASGNPSGLMKIEIVRKIIGLAVLLFSFRFGLTGICAGYAVASFISMAVTFRYALRSIGDPSSLLVKSVALPLGAAAAAALTGWGVSQCVDASWMRLCVGLTAVAVIYPIALRALGIEWLQVIFAKAKSMLTQGNTSSNPQTP